ncbi:hypothetical protein ES705_26403 [subsurface metagenome]
MQTKSLLAVLILVLSTLIIHAQDCAEKDAYTPARGTDERKAILDALREKMYKIHQIKVNFVVNYMKVYDGWAWLHTHPKDANGPNRYEDILALIHKEEGAWIILEIPCGEEDNPDCITSENYYQGLISRHPGLPACILPIN